MVNSNIRSCPIVLPNTLWRRQRLREAICTCTKCSNIRTRAHFCFLFNTNRPSGPSPGWLPLARWCSPRGAERRWSEGAGGNMQPIETSSESASTPSVGMRKEDDEKRKKKHHCEFKGTLVCSCYLADSLRLGDLSSVLVGNQGVENEQQPLQLLCCLVCLLSFRLYDTQNLHHTELYNGDMPPSGTRLSGFLNFLTEHKTHHTSSSPVRTPTKPRSVLCQCDWLKPGPCDPERPWHCPKAERVLG